MTTAHRKWKFPNKHFHNEKMVKNVHILLQEKKTTSSSRFLLKRINKLLLPKPGSLLQTSKPFTTLNFGKLCIIFVHMLVEHKNNF